MTSARPVLLDTPPTSLAERAYRVVRDRLITLEIAPGAPLDDDDLARVLGMGRTPVREALKRLEGDRLVVTYPRRGTFATGTDLVDLADVCEILASLEPLAARRAAERATPEQRLGLAALADTLDDPTTAAGRLDAVRRDLAVHRALYRAAGNPHLEDTLIRYDNLATRIHCMFLDRLPASGEAPVRAHARLLRSVVDGDADTAERLAREHVLDFERAVRAVI